MPGALAVATAEHLDINGDVYTRTVSDLIDTGRLDRVDRVSGFERLLDWAATRSAITYEYRPYTAYQALPPVRECRA